MADQTTESILIAADPDQIMGVIADFPAYPQWAAAVTSADVQSWTPEGKAESVLFGLDAVAFRDTYTLAYDWSDDGMAVHWRLTKGQMQRAQAGSYVLERAGDGTRVTYTLSVELVIPMIGMLRRKAEKIIIDQALRELKRQVERIAAS